MIFRILFLAVILNASLAFADRNEVNRYWFVSDNLMMDDVMRTKEKAFILDPKLAISKDIMKVYKDIQDAVDSNDTSKQQTTFNKYNNTEVFGDGRLAVGVPLYFSAYELGDVKLRPQIKGSFAGGGSASLKSINSNNTPECARAREVLHDPTLDCQTYFGSSPYAQMYWRMDTKVGLNLDFEIGEHWLFSSYFYRMARKDKASALAASQIAAAKDAIDFKKDSNETITMNGDFSLGYRNKNLLVSASVSELRFSKSTDHATEVMTSTIVPAGTKIGDLQVGNSALYHFHSQYAFFPLSWLHFKPFAGVYHRNQYAWGDGIYGGTDLIFTTSKEWFQIATTAKFDPYYFTISPRVRLFHFLEVAYSGKAPTKSEVEGIKTAAIHSINLKLRIDY